MTAAQILEVVKKYEDATVDSGIRARRIDPKRRMDVWARANLTGVPGIPDGNAIVAPSGITREMTAHALYCCSQIREFIASGHLEKAHRWLGFVQGVLWVSGLYSIEELREHNTSTVAEICQ